MSDIQVCLRTTAADYGPPELIWHDLSGVMSEACTTALPQVAHRVCHYHLVADVGEDLYRGPQAALLQRMQALRLPARLKEQRHGQGEQLRAQVLRGRAALVLQALWQGQTPAKGSDSSLGREILLACHAWLLDHPSDGQRQGFPFDPHLLYYHRRVVRVAQALAVWRGQPLLWAGVPAALRNFEGLLSAYLADPQVQQHAAWFEAAAALFERFRSALRLGARGPAPVHEEYALEAGEVRAAQNELAGLREDLRRQTQPEDRPAPERKLGCIVLAHLDRYWSCLGLAEGASDGEGLPVRTTNGLETHWTQGKRLCRQIHGRSRLTRDFAALPAEFMLVPNLHQESYCQQVLGGGLDQLANKFADLSLPEGGFHHWRQEQRPQPCGRLPKRLLRQEHFLDKLLGFWPPELPAISLESPQP